MKKNYLCRKVKKNTAWLGHHQPISLEETPPCSRNLRYEALARSDQKSQNVRLRRANTVIFKGKTALLRGQKAHFFHLRRANTVIFKGKTALLEGKKLKKFVCGALIRGFLKVKLHC